MDSMLRFLDTRLEEMLGALLLAVMVTIAFVNVVVRYCTPFSFAVFRMPCGPKPHKAPQI